MPDSACACIILCIMACWEMVTGKPTTGLSVQPSTCTTTTLMPIVVGKSIMLMPLPEQEPCVKLSPTKPGDKK